MKTVNEIYLLTLREHWSHYKKSGWERKVKSYYKTGIFETLGAKKIKNLTPLMVKRWHGRMRDKPFAANRSLEVLSTICNQAILHGHINQNPCALVKAFTEKKRTQCADMDQLRRIIEEIEKLKGYSLKQKGFILTLIFTGARIVFLKRAKWSELKVFKDGSGVITSHGKSTDKTGYDETVHIPAVVMNNYVLRSFSLQFYTFQAGDNPIFGDTSHRAMWKTIKKNAGLPKDLWLRDLRRSFASAAFSMGVDLGIVGELLNHQDVQTTKRYAKLAMDKRMSASKQVSDSIAGLMKNSG